MRSKKRRLGSPVVRRPQCITPSGAAAAAAAAEVGYDSGCAHRAYSVRRAVNIRERDFMMAPGRRVSVLAISAAGDS